MRHPSLFAACVLVGTTLVTGGSTPSECGRKLVDQSYLCTSTLNDLRSLRLALAEYLRDHEALPLHTSIDNVRPLVQPMYIASLNTVDAWGTPFELTVSADGKSFSVASAGSDRSFDRSSWTAPGLLARSREDAFLSSDRASDREWVIQE